MNRRSYGWFEPATFVCMVLLLWPFLVGDVRLVIRAFSVVVRTPYPSATVCAITQTASITFVCFQIGMAFAAATAICTKIHRDVATLSLRRIHLASALSLMIASGALVGMFIFWKKSLLESPDGRSWQIVFALLECSPPALAMLLGVVLVTETILGRISPESQDTAINVQSERSHWDEVLADTSEPTTRERLLYAIPLIVFIFMVLIAPPLVNAMQLKALRLDLPSPVKPVIYFTGSAHLKLCAALLMISGVYVAWISQSRKRMAIFAIIVTTALLISLFALLLTLVLPLISIDLPCVVEGEVVDTPDGPRPIQDLKPGDSIYCRNPAGDRVEGTIQVVLANCAASFLTFEFSDGTRLRVTSVHPIATPQGYRPAGQLRQGDVVMARVGALKIDSIEIMEKSVNVYDLSVDPHPNFFASGILVHNKMRKK
jgi:hypothetical protein